MTVPLTVLMCVHDGEAYLREAVDSILGQTFRDFELLVIDDGSRDGTAAILASYGDPRLRVVRNETNRGLTASLNIGLRLAAGELVARQDADDRSHPSRFEKQVRFLQANPGVAVLGSGYRNMRAHGRRPRRTVWPACTTKAGIRWQLLFGTPFAHSSVMFRRSVILGELGGYDERFAASQDFELWSRVSRTHAMSNLPESLVDIRSHGASISSRRGPVNYRMIRDILRANMIATLGEGDYEAWLDFWMSVNGAGGTIGSLERAKSDLAAIRVRFEQRYPEAANEPEIARTAGASLAIAACAVAGENRLGALAMYVAAVRESVRFALPRLPWLVLKMTHQRGDRSS